MTGMSVSQSRIGAELDPHSVLFQDLVAHSKNDAASQEGLVQLISDVLEYEVSCNDAALERMGGRPSRVTVFHGHKPPNLSVRAYLERIRIFGGCSACCFVLGIRYVERLQVSAKEPYISAKEPYISAKEPYISAKEPYTSAKEPYVSAKEPYASAKEPHFSAKEQPHLLKRVPFLLKRALFLRKKGAPISPQKIPISPQKSPYISSKQLALSANEP